MKKVVVTLVAGAALLVPSASAMAAGGQGIAGKVAALEAKVAKVQEKCSGDRAPKRCAEKKAALAGKPKRAAALQSARDQVASLIATL